MVTCCEKDENCKDACCTMKLGCIELTAKYHCPDGETGDGSRLDEILDTLEEMQKKIEELEMKIYDCGCCGCEEEPGGDVTIRLSEASRSLPVNGTFQLQAIVGPADLLDKSVVWVSSDPDIATVDQNGVVTAIAEGNVTITATTNVGGKSAGCSVKVVEPSGVYADCSVLLPFGNRFDENLGTDQVRIAMLNGSIACDVDNGGYFNGSAVAAIDDYDIDNEWTMGCWAKFDVLDDYTMLFIGKLSNISHVGVQFLGQTQAAIYCNTAGVLRDVAFIMTDGWHHFLLNSNAELYMDGVHVATGVSGASLSGAPLTMGIGNAPQGYNDPYGARYVNGHISNFFITRKVLNPDEIGSLFALGSTPYHS